MVWEASGVLMVQIEQYMPSDIYATRLISLILKSSYHLPSSTISSRFHVPSPYPSGQGKSIIVTSPDLLEVPNSCTTSLGRLTSREFLCLLDPSLLFRPLIRGRDPLYRRSSLPIAGHLNHLRTNRYMKSTDDSFPVYLSIIDLEIETFRMAKNRENRPHSPPATEANDDGVLDLIKPEGFCE
jgi:hypothetical protein